MLADNEFGFSLTLTDEDDNSVTLSLSREKELARTPQTENLKTQLAKLGNTPFEAKEIEVSFAENWFLPASALADFRRQAIDKLGARRINYRQELAVWKQTNHAFPQTALTYLGNVMNSRAVSFYEEHGVQRVAMAYEKEAVEDAVLMFCKHCLRYSMGWCPIHQRVRSPYKEPYYLVSNDGKRFRLEFVARIVKESKSGAENNSPQRTRRTQRIRAFSRNRLFEWLVGESVFLCLFRTLCGGSAVFLLVLSLYSSQSFL